MELESLPNPPKWEPKLNATNDQKFERIKIDENGALERLNTFKVAPGGRQGVTEGAQGSQGRPRVRDID